MLAQENWFSWSDVVNTKGYEGQRFKVTAKDKADVTDDSASARLWVKIVVTKGYGFFNNMQYPYVAANGKPTPLKVR